MNLCKFCLITAFSKNGLSTLKLFWLPRLAHAAFSTSYILSCIYVIWLNVPVWFRISIVLCFHYFLHAFIVQINPKQNGPFYAPMQNGLKSLKVLAPPLPARTFSPLAISDEWLRAGFIVYITDCTEKARTFSPSAISDEWRRSEFIGYTWSPPSPREDVFALGHLRWVAPRRLYRNTASIVHYEPSAEPLIADGRGRKRPRFFDNFS